jgi:hypothetical protein
MRPSDLTTNGACRETGGHAASRRPPHLKAIVPICATPPSASPKKGRNVPSALKRPRQSLKATM